MSNLGLFLVIMTGTAIGMIIGYLIYKAIPKNEPEVKVIERWIRNENKRKQNDRNLGIAFVIGIVLFIIICMSDGTYADRVEYIILNMRAHESITQYVITVNDGIFMFFSSMVASMFVIIYMFHDLRKTKYIKAYKS